MPSSKRFSHWWFWSTIIFLLLLLLLKNSKANKCLEWAWHMDLAVPQIVFLRVTPKFLILFFFSLSLILWQHMQQKIMASWKAVKNNSWLNENCIGRVQKWQACQTIPATVICVLARNESCSLFTYPDWLPFDIRACLSNIYSKIIWLCWWSLGIGDSWD